MWTHESFDEIQKGDTVYYETPQGQTHSGRAMLRGPAGWVLKTTGGLPKVVNDGYNYLGHTPAKNRQPDHLGAFLYD